MSSIQSYKDFIVWQKAIDISVETYHLTCVFPKDEIFGLTNQARRAANSISLNIAEGYGRNTTKNYVNSLYIAKGSLQELESAVILGCRLGFVKENSCDKIFSLINEESKMFNSLIKSLENKINNNKDVRMGKSTNSSILNPQS